MCFLIVPNTKCSADSFPAIQFWYETLGKVVHTLQLAVPAFWSNVNQVWTCTCLSYMFFSLLLKECMLQTNVLLKHKMVHMVLLKDASFTITTFNSLHNDECFCLWNGAVEYLSWMFLIPLFFHMCFICGDTHMSFHLLLFNPVSPHSSPSSVRTPINTYRPSQR
jgi:hypothetical protein